MQQTDQEVSVLKSWHNTGFFSIAVILLIVGFLYWAAFSNINKRAAERVLEVKQFLEHPTAGADPIEVTLQKVNLEMKRKADVNGDELTNCIDAAVLFYQYYPYKQEVAIIVNKNANTGMNHLFNAVIINDTWRAIEPQSVYSNNKSYFMKEVWGRLYDHTKNKDVTEQYKVHVK